MPLVLAALLFCACARPPLSGRERDPWAGQVMDKRAIEVDEELARIQNRIERGEIPKVQFEFDKSVILPESYIALDLIADALLKKPDLKLRISAHTCSMGSEEYNLKLSERRAKAVMDYLVKRGLPPPSIRYRGAGFSEPIADNSSEEGREKNRRVEFRITQRDWGSVY